MYKEIMIAGAIGCATAMSGCCTGDHVDTSSVYLHHFNNRYSINVNGNDVLY